MKIKYKISRELCTYNTYSIIFQNGKQINKISDAFASKEKAQNFIDICNKHNIEPVHIYNVLDDYL